jgi:hypothetical protein
VSIFKIKSLFAFGIFRLQDCSYEYPFWQNPQIEWLLSVVPAFLFSAVAVLASSLSICFEFLRLQF